MDLNVGYSTSYGYYEAGGLPGGMSIGGSAGIGSVGISASAGFGVPPYYMVTQKKKVKVAGKSFDLIFPKPPFIKSSFSGVGLSYNLASYPPAEEDAKAVEAKAEAAESEVAEAAEDDTAAEEALSSQLDAAESFVQTKAGEKEKAEADFTLDVGWSMSCRRWDASVTKCFQPQKICFMNCGEENEVSSQLELTEE